MQKYFDINSNKNSIKAKLYYNDIKTIKKVAVFGHGFAGHKDNRAAARFSEYVLSKYKDIAVITFDWPGHGDDVKKTLLLDDCTAYMDAVINYIRTVLKVNEIYGSATSFGGYLFLKYISEKGSPFVKTVLRCPAIRMHEVIKKILTEDDLNKLKKGKPISAGFDRKVTIIQQNIDSLNENVITNRDFLPYAENILIIQGDRDELVDFTHSKEFCEQNVIEFYPVYGADHRFIDPKKMDDAIKKTVGFFGFNKVDNT